MLLLYWDWHLTELGSALTWVNLNDKISFRGILCYNRTAWLLHRRGGKEEESKFPSNPQWCHWPVRRLWPTPVNPCKSDASNLCRWLDYHTFKFRKQLLSEVPITEFSSPLIFFFFKNTVTADFLPALPLLSEGRLSDGFLISIPAKAMCFSWTNAVP